MPVLVSRRGVPAVLPWVQAITVLSAASCPVAGRHTPPRVRVLLGLRVCGWPCGRREPATTASVIAAPCPLHAYAAAAGVARLRGGSARRCPAVVRECARPAAVACWGAPTRARPTQCAVSRVLHQAGRQAGRQAGIQHASQVMLPGLQCFGTVVI